MFQIMRQEKGFLGLLEVLLALVIIAIMYIFIMKVYFNKPNNNDEIQKSLLEYNIDISTNPAATSPQGIIDNTKEKVDALNKKRLEQYKQVDRLENGN